MLLLGTALTAAAGQAGGAPPGAQAYSVDIKNLHPDKVIRLSAPGFDAIASKIKCGPGGDIFAVYSGTASLELWSAPIRKISLSSQRITEYFIPTISGYDNLARLGFDVDADGRLYALLRGHPQPTPQNGSGKWAYLIARYKEDGSFDRHFNLSDLPSDQIQPMSFSMFADGDSLVSGTTRGNPGGAGSPGVFSAIFDQTGAFRTPVAPVTVASSAKFNGSSGAQNSAPSPEHQDAVSLVSSLLSFSSSDGNIYLLQDSRLVVVSEGGSIEHEFRLAPPNNDLSPIQMAAAGAGYLFAFYDHVATGEPGENTQRRGMITVVSSQTGDVVAIYRLPEAETDFTVAACAVSSNDFVFLGTDSHNYLELVYYRSN